jgi:hypothetical protein
VDDPLEPVDVPGHELPGGVEEGARAGAAELLALLGGSARASVVACGATADVAPDHSFPGGRHGCRAAQTVRLDPAIDHDAIAATVQMYIDGSAQGDTAMLSEAFHPDAQMYGAVGDHRYDEPITEYVKLVGDSPGGETMRAEITSLAQAGDAVAATVVEGFWGDAVLRYLPRAGPDRQPLAHRQQELRSHRRRDARGRVTAGKAMEAQAARSLPCVAAVCCPLRQSPGSAMALLLLPQSGSVVTVAPLPPALLLFVA